MQRHGHTNLAAFIRANFIPDDAEMLLRVMRGKTSPPKGWMVTWTKGGHRRLRVRAMRDQGSPAWWFDDQAAQQNRAHNADILGPHPDAAAVLADDASPVGDHDNVLAAARRASAMTAIPIPAQPPSPSPNACPRP